MSTRLDPAWVAGAGARIEVGASPFPRRLPERPSRLVGQTFRKEPFIASTTAYANHIGSFGKVRQVSLIDRGGKMQPRLRRIARHTMRPGVELFVNLRPCPSTLSSNAIREQAATPLLEARLHIWSGGAGFSRYSAMIHFTPRIYPTVSSSGMTMQVSEVKCSLPPTAIHPAGIASAGGKPKPSSREKDRRKRDTRSGRNIRRRASLRRPR